MASTAAHGGHGPDADGIEYAALLALLAALRAGSGAADFELRVAYERGREDERAAMRPRRCPAARGSHLRAVHG